MEKYNFHQHLRLWPIKIYFTIAGCFLVAKGYSQSSFTSPITQHWPTIFSTEFEDVDRTIYIDSGSITLTTKTKEGKLIEVYIIKEIKEGRTDLRFLCETRNSQDLITVIIPHQEKIEIIDIYRPSEVTGEVEQIRLWVN